MADRGSQSQTSGRNLFGRSVHAAKNHVPVGQAGLQPVVYIFRVEEFQGGVYEIHHGDYATTGQRLFPSEFLAEHSGYFERISAKWWAAGVYRAPGAGSHRGGELWNLRAGVRIDREPPG